MKLFSKKEEKLKVGRPKLADIKTKKKAIISVCIALVLVVALLLTGAFKLNIIKFNKLKGAANYTCDSIPEEFKLSDNNPNGFDDINFYSAVAKSINNNDSTICNTLTEEDMKSITHLYANNSGIKSINGYQYLENLQQLNLSNNNLELLEIKDMAKLEYLYYYDNNNLKSLVLKNLDLLKYTSSSRLDKLEYLEIDNVPELKDTGITSKSLRKIRLVNSPSLSHYIDFESSTIESVYVDNISHLGLSSNFQDNMYKNLKSFKAYNVNDLYEIAQLRRSSLEEFDIKNVVLREGDYLSLRVTGENIKNFDIVSLSNLLSELIVTNLKDDTIDLSANTNLISIIVDGGNLKYLNLLNNDQLGALVIRNTNLEKIDLSNQKNLSVLFLNHNKIQNDIYLQKGQTFNYDDLIKLNDNYKITFNVEKSNVGKVENNVFTALDEGETKVKLSNENIMSFTDLYLDCTKEDGCDEEYEKTEILTYFFENKIKVYDVTSKVYKVDKKNKTIDANNESFNIDDVKVTDGYTKELDGDNLIIKDGDMVVQTYTIINTKPNEPETIPKPTTTTKQNSNITKKNKKATTTKQNKTTEFKTTTSTTMKQDLPEGDIVAYGNYIPDTLLKQVKGEDKTLTLINDDVSIVINGKDIEKVKDINIKYKLSKLKDNKKVENGMLLEFINKSTLAKKILVEIKATDEFKEVVGLSGINLYSYKNGKLTLIKDNINVEDDKVSFYTNELDKYVFTNEIIENDKKEINKLFIIIPLILIILTIGYVIYKKMKGEEDA